MNRNSWIAVGILLITGMAVFGIFWTLPRHDYLPQEKRSPATETLP